MAWQTHQELKFFIPELQAAAKLANLDETVVAGVVLTESSGFTNAYRYEPKFWERYQLAKQPEYVGQNPRRISASYGLMQIMYPTAKELGYARTPEDLFAPDRGLQYGCLHLRRCLDWAAQYVGNDKEHLVAGLAAFNGGRSSAQRPPSPLNVQYSLRVLKNMELLG